METFWTMVKVIFLLWCLLTDIIYIVIKKIKFANCKDIKECKNRKCLVKESCKNYDEHLTEEEYDYLINLLHNTFGEENTQNEKR